MIRRSLCRSRCAALAVALAAVPTSAGIAQSGAGSATAAVVGGALGAYSGFLLGMMGATIPCSQTLRAVRCIQLSAGTAAAGASIGGVLLGSADGDRVWRVSRNVGIGAAAGVLAGVGLSQVTQRVGPRDVGALALLGGAIGAAPRGAGIGLGLGGAVGLILMGVTDLALPDAIGVAAAGVAVGGVAQWILDAHDAQSAGGGPAVTLIAHRLAF